MHGESDTHKHETVEFMYCFKTCTSEHTFICTVLTINLDYLVYVLLLICTQYLYTLYIYNIYRTLKFPDLYTEFLYITFVSIMRALYIYLYKEELKRVVRELLACTQPNCHETPTALWNLYHRVSSSGQRVQIRFSRGASGKKPENDCPPFWFNRESIRASVHGSHIVMEQSIIV